MIRPTDQIFKSFVQEIKYYIPTVTKDPEESECGRIGVVGGCSESGHSAYIVALSALKVGADRAFVIRTSDTIPDIESNPHGLIEVPHLNAADAMDKISPCLEKIDSLVVGSGLGRDPIALRNTEAIINYCNTLMTIPLPLIIDSDGLYIVCRKPDLIRNYKGLVVLTPDAEYYSKLCSELGFTEAQEALMSRFLNAVIVKKGETDVISNGIYQNVLNLPKDWTTIETDTDPTVSSCPGQGDVLSGCTAVFVAWCISSRCRDQVSNFTELFVLRTSEQRAIETQDQEARKRFYINKYECFSLACFAACLVTRQSCRFAIPSYKPELTPLDLVDSIQSAFAFHFGR